MDFAGAWAGGPAGAQQADPGGGGARPAVAAPWIAAESVDAAGSRPRAGTCAPCRAAVCLLPLQDTWRDLPYDWCTLLENVSGIGGWGAQVRGRAPA